MKDKRKVFLIVDDEPDMCWALENILKKNGFLSKKALNGHEALALIKSGRFQAAFLDAKLPDMDGLDLARELLNIDPGIHIVMISGYFYQDDDAVQEAISEGLIKGFIGKPFDHDEILKVIKAPDAL